MTAGIVTFILCAVLIGGIAQRVAGIGFGLLLAPFLVIMLGPQGGVVLTNVGGALVAALMIRSVWRQIEWKMYLWLGVPAVIGVIIGSASALALPRAPLEIGVGLFLLLALAASLLLNRTSVTVDGSTPRVVAGLIAGISNSMAGAGVPAVSAYAILGRWRHSSFVATMQPFLTTLSCTTLLVRGVLSPGQWPQLAWWVWIAICLLIIAGLYLGEKLTHYIKERGARRVVVVLAFLGSVSALGKGLLDLAG